MKVGSPMSNNHSDSNAFWGINYPFMEASNEMKMMAI